MLGHGADLDKIKRKYRIDGPIIDFSSNINPSIPDGLAHMLVANIDSLRAYPDIEYMELRNAIAAYIGGLGPENICVGNGASELIFLFMKSIKGSLVIIGPTFSEYARAAQISGLDYRIVSMDVKGDSFELAGLDRLDAIGDLEAIVVCNPNNPDGGLKDLSSLVKYCHSRSVKLLVDETFIEFCRDYDDYTCLNYDYEDIFVLRAMTKFYGMPGLRMGYLLSKNKDFVGRLYSIKEPWTVNSMAEKITIEVLKREVENSYTFGENTRSAYEKERAYLVRELDKIKVIRVYRTDSAFILLEMDKALPYTSASIKDCLIRQHSILIRDASNFYGLSDRFIRLAIKDRKSNEILLDALFSIFGGGNL
nr:aminotransferase class I/II-fold pyridoxal phosphate-dependent enzyme [uncultured Peptostreptococcus sp.]